MSSMTKTFWQKKGTGHCNGTLVLLPRHTAYKTYVYTHAVRSTPCRYSLCYANVSWLWCSSQDDYQILAIFGLSTLPHIFGHNLPWGFLYSRPPLMELLSCLSAKRMDHSAFASITEDWTKYQGKTTIHSLSSPTSLTLPARQRSTLRLISATRTI